MMVDKTTYSELFIKLRDPAISDEELQSYFIVVPGDGGLDFNLEVNPETVSMSEADEELESAMKIGNGIARLRRRILYFDRIKSHPERPTIITEGDSWFQFPLLINETVDYLTQVYNVWSLGAAGDTLANMVHGTPGAKGFEFLKSLRRHKRTVRAFLFSGAGNDIIGEDPNTKLPMLEGLLEDFNGDAGDISGHINHVELQKRLDILQTGYRQIIALVRSEPGLETLPIVFHGYDYPYPYPWGNNDPRNPKYAKKDQWLGRAFASRSIRDDNLRRGILIHMIDRLYDTLETLEEKPSVVVVDCRGALPNLDDWNDEIHGTSSGFVEVGRRFHSVMTKMVTPDGDVT